jgi:predicted permease
MNVRIFRHAPAFAVVVVGVLAVGLAFVITAASLGDTVFAKPLPYVRSDRLVMLWGRRLNNAFMTEMNVSGPAFLEWQAHAKSFTGVAGFTFPAPMHLSGSDSADRVSVAEVTANTLSVLGVRVPVGRDLAVADEKAGDRAVLISNSLWRRQFGQRTDAIGARIRLNDEPAVVVGILPSTFYLANLIVLRVDALTVLRGNEPWFHDRRTRPLMVFARLADAAALGQSQREMDGIAATQAIDHPDTDAGWGVFVQDVARDALAYWRPTLVVVIAAAGCLMLIVVGTVLLLLIARVVDREHELTLRVALGASRWHLFQTWAEDGLALCIPALGIGTLLSLWLLDAFVRLDIPYFPRIDEVGLTVRAIAAGSCVAALVAVSFGMIAAGRRGRAVAGLQTRSATSDRSQGRLQTGLLIAQVAITIVLGAAGGILTRDVVQLARLDMGFDRERLFTVRLAMPLEVQKRPGVARALYAELKTTLEREFRPGSVTFDANPPTTGSATVFFGAPPIGSGANRPWADSHIVDPSYFHVMRIPFIAGGPPSDDEGTNGRTVVVNRTLVQRYFHGRSAIGEELVLAGNPDADPGTTQLPLGRARIVGVVGDTIDWPLAKSRPNQVYVGIASHPPSSTYVLIRDAPPDAFSTVRRITETLNKNIAVYDAASIDARLARVLAMKRFSAAAAFAVAAFGLLLAVLAIFGVIVYRIGRRSRELGIRLALGASSNRLVRDATREGAAVVTLGVAFGVTAAMSSRSVLDALVFAPGSNIAEAAIIGVIGMFVIVLGTVASYVAAMRTARMNPADALRAN